MENASNPWLEIWVKPKQAIRAILTSAYKASFWVLCAVYGLPFVLNSVQSLGIGMSVPLWAILVGSVLLCPFVGVIGVSLVSWFLYICGKWIGGKGSFKEIRTAVAWSNVPNIVTLGMWCVLFSMFGSQVLDRSFSEAHIVGYQAGVLFLLMLVELIISVWVLFILLNVLAEVQQFSLWRAFFNLAIPFAGVIVAMWLLGSLLYGVGG